MSDHRGISEEEWIKTVYDNFERFSNNTAVGGGAFCGAHGHVRAWAGGPAAKPSTCYCGAVRYESHRCTCGDTHERMVHNTSRNTDTPIYVQLT